MRVLVVEDEVSIAKSLRAGLEGEGYVVEVAHDGEEGLWRASEFAFDVAVLDIMIPKLNGFIVTRRLREAGRTVPILMLTAKSGEFDQTEALDAGADDFLSQPFSYPVLLARLRALIRRGSIAIDLTPKEFVLASYLLLRQGEVISKQALLRHVWDDVDVFDTNVVEIYVGYLRRKIDTPFGRASVETVRRPGGHAEGEGDVVDAREPAGDDRRVAEGGGSRAPPCW